jgi:hypothetical protein
MAEIRNSFEAFVLSAQHREQAERNLNNSLLDPSSSAQPSAVLLVQVERRREKFCLEVLLEDCRRATVKAAALRTSITPRG